MRARNLKPGFFKNEDLAEIDPLGRLLFQGLWCMADREGRLEDRPKRIKAEILPYDSIDIEDLLSTLTSKNFIIRYDVGGGRFIQVINFAKHQDPHYKESPSEIPPPPGYENGPRKHPALKDFQKEEVYKRDGKKCRNCGATKKLTIDHITPLSLGGDNLPSNLQVLCNSCNASKNNRMMSGQHQPKVGPTSGGLHPLTPDSLNLTPESLNLNNLADSPPANGRNFAQEFEGIFYPAYPNKKKPAYAKQAYISKGKKGRLPPVQDLVSVLEVQKVSDDWTKEGGRYIPHPSTWINGEQWLNRPVEAAPKRISADF